MNQFPSSTPAGKDDGSREAGIFGLLLPPPEPPRKRLVFWLLFTVEMVLVGLGTGWLFSQGIHDDFRPYIWPMSWAVVGYLWLMHTVRCLWPNWVARHYRRFIIVSAVMLPAGILVAASYLAWWTSR